MSLEIFLVRQGETVFNQSGRLQGWSDSPLTDKGKAQAAAVGRRLLENGVRFDAAFSSTSPSATDTAHTILANMGQLDVPILRLSGLRDYHYGGFEGGLEKTLHMRLAKERGFTTVEEWLMAYRYGGYDMMAETVSKIDPHKEAETETEFLVRLNNGLYHVLGGTPKPGKALVVSHGLAICTLIKSIDRSAMLYENVPNASVSRLRYSEVNGLSIVGIADGGLLGSKDRPTVAALTQVAKALGYRL